MSEKASDMTRIKDWSVLDKEWFLIFAVCVAGKNSKSTQKAVHRLRVALHGNLDDPAAKRIGMALERNELKSIVRSSRVGNYTKIIKFLCDFRVAAIDGLDILTATPGQLEEMHGIGPKTSRFFILHTRPNEEYAALDVHILRWLRTKGYDAPKSTPTGPRYLELERSFISEAKNRGMSPAELDSVIWSAAANGGVA